MRDATEPPPALPGDATADVDMQSPDAGGVGPWSTTSLTRTGPGTSSSEEVSPAPVTNDRVDTDSEPLMLAADPPHVDPSTAVSAMSLDTLAPSLPDVSVSDEPTVGSPNTMTDPDEESSDSYLDPLPPPALSGQVKHRMGPDGVPAAAKSKLAARIRELRLARIPLTLEEKDIATVAAFALQRGLRSARQEGSIIFPLSPAVMTKYRASPPTSVGATLDAVFGTDSGPDPVMTWLAPVTPEVDSTGVETLPKAREMLTAMAQSVSPIDHLPAVNTTPIPIPLKESLGKGPKRWGRDVRVDEMSLEHRTAWRKLIRKELATGALVAVEDLSKVKLLCPVFLAVHPVTLKPRLVHDLRPLNSRLKPPPAYKLGTVRDVLAFRARFATKADISSAFKHVEVSERFAQHLCFAVGDTVFKWRRLPFGCSHSPALFAAALQPVIDELRAKGVRLVIYVDDFCVLADSVNDLDQALVETIQALTKHGWRMAPDKSFTVAHSALVFVGLRIDLERRRLEVPEGKAAKLLALVRSARAKRRVRLETLQKIMGLLAFLLPAVSWVGLAWCGMRLATIEASANPGRHVPLKGALSAELAFWEEAASSLPKWSAPTDPEPTDLHVVTDASDVGCGIVWWPGGHPAPSLEGWVPGEGIQGTTARTATVKLPIPCRQEASAVRELLALLAALRGWKAGGAFDRLRPPPGFAANDLNSGNCLPALSASDLTSPPLSPTLLSPNDVSRRISVHWTSDSTAAVGAIGLWRSPSPALSAVLLRIAALCAECSLSIKAVWVARTLGWLPAADYLSRSAGRRAQAEWALPSAQVQLLLGWADLSDQTSDMFASITTRRLNRYHSRYSEPGSLGDALSAVWPEEAYAFPPFSLLPAALQRWRETAPPSSTLLLVFPRLPGVQNLWTTNEVKLPPRDLEVRLLNHLGRQARSLPPTPLGAVVLCRPPASLPSHPVAPLPTM